MSAAWTDNFAAAGYDWTDLSVYTMLRAAILERWAVVFPSQPLPLAAYSFAAGMDVQQAALWRDLQEATQNLILTGGAMAWKKPGNTIAGQNAAQGFAAQPGPGPGWAWNGQDVFWLATYQDRGHGVLADVRADAGLSTLLLGGAISWRRKRPREVIGTSAGLDSSRRRTWTSGTTDTPSGYVANTLVDGMIAWIIGSTGGYGQTAVARYDGTAHLWTEVAGLTPDILDSASTATGWQMSPGACSAGDYLGGWLVDELVKTLGQLQAVAVRGGEPYGVTATVNASYCAGSSYWSYATAADAEAAAIAAASATVALPSPVGSAATIETANDPVLPYFASVNFEIVGSARLGSGSFAWAGGATFGTATPTAGLPSVSGQLTTYAAVCAPGWAEEGWGFGWPSPAVPNPLIATSFGGSVPTWAAQNTFAIADQSSPNSIVPNGNVPHSAVLGTSTLPTAWPTPLVNPGDRTAYSACLGWEVGAVIQVIDFRNGGNFQYPPP